MEPQQKEKAKRLINETRVMTLSVCRNDMPWSSPVYFVFQIAGRTEPLSKPDLHLRVVKKYVSKFSFL